MLRILHVFLKKMLNDFSTKLQWLKTVSPFNLFKMSIVSALVVCEDFEHQSRDSCSRHVELAYENVRQYCIHTADIG